MPGQYSNAQKPNYYVFEKKHIINFGKSKKCYIFVTRN